MTCFNDKNILFDELMVKWYTPTTAGSTTYAVPGAAAESLSPNGNDTVLTRKIKMKQYFKGKC